MAPTHVGVHRKAFLNFPALVFKAVLGTYPSFSVLVSLPNDTSQVAKFYILRGSEPLPQTHHHTKGVGA